MEVSFDISPTASFTFLFLNAISNNSMPLNCIPVANNVSLNMTEVGKMKFRFF